MLCRVPCKRSAMPPSRLILATGNTLRYPQSAAHSTAPPISEITQNVRGEQPLAELSFPPKLSTCRSAAVAAKTTKTTKPIYPG